MKYSKYAKWALVVALFPALSWAAKPILKLEVANWNKGYAHSFLILDDGTLLGQEERRRSPDREIIQKELGRLSEEKLAEFQAFASRLPDEQSDPVVVVEEGEYHSHVIETICTAIQPDGTATRLEYRDTSKRVEARKSRKWKAGCEYLEAVSRLRQPLQ